MRRHVIELLERRKEAMISALWANSNYDDDKGTRSDAIKEIEESFQEIVDKVNGITREEEIDDTNPFFDAAKRGAAKIQKPKNTTGKVRDAVDYKRFTDQ